MPSRTALTVNAARLGVVEGRVVDLRVVEHSLGRDAADVEARATERAALLDACGLCGPPFASSARSGVCRSASGPEGRLALRPS